GQYGAYGYALAGWNWQQIVGHYYGGTSITGVDPNRPIAVHLNELDWATTTVRDALGGSVTAWWPGGSYTAGQISVARSGSALSINGTTIGADVTLTASSLLGVAVGGGWRSYPGSLTVKAGTNQTWNTVTLEQYVAGVVPAESPASWGTNGLAALEAQAVAARSYALAYLAGGGNGSICDTTACQVYDGDQDAAGTPTNSLYTHYSDQAQQATAGQILTCNAGTACGSPGAVAFTEFSSSTGGYTAGGRFPAVPDDGDATPSNPNHTWVVSIPATTIQAVWPSIGALTAVTVTARNGLGDLGGRAQTVVVAGTAGSVTVSGDTFSAALGLRSDWYSTQSYGVPAGGDNGYWVAGASGGVSTFGGAGSFGSLAGVRLNAPVVSMAPSADQSGYWLVGGDGGIFSFG
ncbi:MAG: SpoIID/LytB domain-containing protein, partial [Acidimicrobiales bacterium]